MVRLLSQWKLAAGILIAAIEVWTRNIACASEGPELRVLSSRADAVSGDEVLVQLSTPSHARWLARLNKRDVTAAFREVAASDYLIGLLTELHPGSNLLEISTEGIVRSRLEIVDHALVGPVFSGPHQQPFVCETEANGLGPAIDTDCSAKTSVQYFYRSTEPIRASFSDELEAALGIIQRPIPAGFKVYDPSRPVPSDMATTVTSDGHEVNYIVRREMGTINRAVYGIWILHQPGQPLPTPWIPKTPGWNGRLVYLFGGGCGAGYHQGKLGSFAPEQERLLAKGYAVSTSTLNIFQNTCNDRISAETLSMVEEHFIKRYGPPTHTIGLGSSGGAVQQYLIAQNYPGLLDGVVAGLSFPDQMSAAHSSSITDCALLDHAFRTSEQNWTEEQKTAISGLATWRTCVVRLSGLTHLDPRRCDRSMPKDMVYDQASNASGVRCDLYDNEINVLGRDPKTGFARRPLDNVGVQYGLGAFQSGSIDAERFVELNEHLGGYDYNGNIVAARTTADPDTLRIAYQRGLVMTGGGGLSQIPIIDWRPYSDDLADVHARFESFVARARLVAANGSAANQAILVDPRIDLMRMSVDPAVAQRMSYLVEQMDNWLNRLAADSAPGTLPQRVARSRPVELADGCWATDGERIVEAAEYEGPGRCNQLYPSHGDPRLVAGAPLTEDTLKCALEPLEAGDYSHPLSTSQLQRLNAIFPGGVCDYSRPGVGQRIVEATWQRYPFDDLDNDLRSRNRAGAMPGVPARALPASH